MRILFITHTYSLRGGGGGEVFVEQLLRGLVKHGHKVLVVAPRGAPFEKEEKELDIQVVRTPMWGHHGLHKYWQLMFSHRAVEKARAFKPEVIHAHNDVISGLVGTRLSRALNAPMVVNVEYLSSEAASLNMKMVFWLNKLFLARLPFEHVTCWSKFVIDEYLLPWGISEKDITYVPAAIDTESYRPGRDGSAVRKKYPGPLVVSAKPLYTTNAKGLLVTIRAMLEVRKEVPGVKFVVYGEGTHKKQLEDLVKKLGLEDTVKFEGQVENAQVPDIYAAADVVAHSFAFEATTSIALLESMASGCAVVVTATGEVKRTTGDAAVLVEPENPHAMAQGIIKLLKDPVLRKELGEKAAKHIRENFSVDASVKKFEGVYKQAIRQ